MVYSDRTGTANIEVELANDDQEAMKAAVVDLNQRFAAKLREARRFTYEGA